MTAYKRYAMLALVLIISGLYCSCFFNGYLGLSDGNDYAGLARSIIRGDGFSLGHLYPLAFSFNAKIPQPDNLWAPAYPVYLALWFLIFGMSDSVILSAIILSVWLYILAVYFVMEKLSGANWALLAAAMIGLNQSMLATALEGSPEPLTATLFLFSIYVLMSRTSSLRIIISAVLFGLAVLTRYQIIVLAIPVLFFLTDRKLRTVLLWTAVTFLVLLPWLIRNYVVLGNPFFTLQAYGEFTKSMGHLGYYYYTYRSFTPMSLWYALAHFPFYVLKKFIAGLVFFSWWTLIALNFFGAITFIYSVLKRNYFDSLQKKFICFGVTTLILLVALSSFDGIHLRHLANIQGILIMISILGLIRIKERIPLFRNRYLWIAAVVLLFLPIRFPHLESELISYAERVKENKEVYNLIREYTQQDAVIVSDASDGVWWYCDRPSIWVPVIYSDFKTLLEIQKVDYFYLENSTDYLEGLNDDELLDFLTNTAIIDGTPFGWSLYRINR
jgi:hypothetical protein